MYDRILLSTDGTVASERAGAHALDLAAAHDAVLHVPYVVDEDVVTAYSGDEDVDETEGPEHSLEEHGRRRSRNSVAGGRRPGSASSRRCDTDAPPRPS